MNFTVDTLGKSNVLALIRQKFWSVGARALIKRVLKECGVCRKLSGNPQVQRMADLPFDRITPGKPPFSFVGVDCFGPFVVAGLKSSGTAAYIHALLRELSISRSLTVLKLIPLSMAL